MEQLIKDKTTILFIVSIFLLIIYFLRLVFRDTSFEIPFEILCIMFYILTIILRLYILITA